MKKYILNENNKFLGITREDVIQYRVLDKSIADIEEQIVRLETAATRTTTLISGTGIPNIGGKSNDKMAEMVTLICENKELLMDMMIKQQKKYNKIIKATKEISDPLMRIIITKKYLNGMKWKDISTLLDVNENSLRSRAKQFWDLQETLKEIEEAKEREENKSTVKHFSIFK